MDCISNYMQVGTTIYKKSMKPTISEGVFVESLIKWRLDILKEDYPADYKTIEKFDGFWNEPNNINYSREIVSGLGRPYYNKYKTPVHKPKEGSWKNIEKFLRHIFGGRYELFLDYMAILYVRPKRKLPAICLLSKEKGTGKSTFLVFIEAILGENSARVNRETFMSRFNGDWSEAQACTMDEARFVHDKEMNRLKYLITENLFVTELKGVERVPTPFYGKFFFASNHESDFIKVDEDDDRFWIEKVKVINPENKDPFLMVKMFKEIPAFLMDIINREVKVEKEARLFFPRELYITSAFYVLVKASRSSLENELVTGILSLMDDGGFETFFATPKDLEEYIGRSPKSILTEVRRILKEQWQLIPERNAHMYKRKFRSTRGEILEEDSKGRYYCLEKSFFEKRFDDLMI